MCKDTHSKSDVFISKQTYHLTNSIKVSILNNDQR